MLREEMLARIPATERDEWEVLEVVDPWGQAREDYRFAMLAATISNALGLRKEKGRLFVVSDFLLNFFARPTAPVLLRPVMSATAIERDVLRWVTSTNIMFAERRKGIN